MTSVGDFQWEQDIDPTTQTGRTVFNGMKWLDTSEDPPVPKWREGSAWAVMTTLAGEPGGPGEAGPPGEDGAITTVDDTASITLSIVDSELTANIVDLYITNLLDGVFEPADADIQSHLGNTSNPHSVTKSQVGLGSVDNTTDVGKPISTLTQAALDLKQNADSDLTAIGGLTPTNDDLIQRKAGAWTNRSMAQVKTDLVLVKADVGLSNVDNTSDASKPVSTLTQSALDLKADDADLDTHVSDTSNPHSTTKTQVGLGSVDNTTDIGKPISTLTQAALDLKQPLDSDLTTIAGLTPTTDNFLVAASSAWASRTPAQAKTALGLVKADVGLSNVDNTSDASKPISTLTQSALDLKQPLDSDLTTIAGLTATTDNFLVAASSAWASRTPAQAKTSLGLVKADVGLGNVDNTSDASKPVSTATQTALDLKQPLDSDLTTIAGLTATSDNFMVAAASAWASRTPAQAKTSLALVKADVGLANVDNTTDAAKPISTLTQTALDLKATAGAALTEVVEASSTPVAGATSTALGSGIRVFAFFTLPTTEKWYVITGIEWLNKATINGNVWCGVERVDANPPVIPGTVNVATGARIAHAGSNAAQRNSQIASQPIRGGTILGVWFTSDSASATFGNTAVSNNNNRKTLAAGTPALADVTAWTASTAGYYVKAYYQGIK